MSIQTIKPLNVKYFSQRDNREESWRTCNTSCCAMVADFIKPGCISGDDGYKDIVDRFGDTTCHEAQTRALASLGINSRFDYNLSYRELDNSLILNKPIVIGVLHRGHYQTPYGGHMIVVIGKYEDGYICHDPWGVPFHYSATNGANCKIPFQSLDTRWLCDGPYSGWGRIFV
ncbi:MAG: C39 family peptidase [Lyngbya sp.]|nr:C39 family peptidase [Lyngbya sp.]